MIIIETGWWILLYIIKFFILKEKRKKEKINQLINRPRGDSYKKCNKCNLERTLKMVEIENKCSKIKGKKNSLTMYDNKIRGKIQVIKTKCKIMRTKCLENAFKEFLKSSNFSRMWSILFKGTTLIFKTVTKLRWNICIFHV